MKIQFTCPGRQVLEQINLQVPSEYGGARQAAVAVFNAIYDQGSNNPTTVFVNIGEGSLGVGVVEGKYVHGDQPEATVSGETPAVAEHESKLHHFLHPHAA